MPCSRSLALPLALSARLVLGACLGLTAMTGASRAQDAPADAPVAPAPSDPLARARTLLDRAHELRRGGSTDEALAAVLACEEAALLASNTDAHLLAEARLCKAMALVAAGIADEAVMPLAEARSLARDLSDRPLLARALSFAAELLGATGDGAGAHVAARELAALRLEEGEPGAAGRALLLAADLAPDAGGSARVRADLDAAVLAFTRAADDDGLVEALERRAGESLRAGAPADALSDTGAALQLIAGGERDPSREARILVLSARAEAKVLRLDRALEASAAALKAADLAADPAAAADARELLADLLLSARQPRAAADHALALIGLRRQLGETAGEGRAQQALGACLVALGRLEAGLAALRTGRELLAARGTPAERAAVLVLEGRTLGDLRRPLEASQAFEQALASLEEAGGTVKEDSSLAPVPLREEVLEDLLTSLVGLGAWARALEVALEADGHGSPGIDAWRDRARQGDATVLAVRAGRSGVLTWSLAPGGVLRGAAVAGLTAIEATALAQEANSLARAGLTLSPGDAGSGESGAPLRSALRRLHDLLVAPVQDGLPSGPGGVVLVVASKGLRSVPFPLLLDDENRALGERFTLSESLATPEVREVQEVREAPAAHAEGPSVVLASGAVPSPFARAVHVAAVRRRHVRLFPLQVDREPAEAVQGDSTLVAGGASTADTVALTLAGAAVVHVLVPCAGGGLVLDTLGATPGRATPGSVIAAWRLTGATVVLDACDGDAAEDVAVALAAAGARHVIALRWPLPEPLGTRVAIGLAAALQPGRSAPEAVAALLAEIRAEAPVAAGALRVFGPSR